MPRTKLGLWLPLLWILVAGPSAAMAQPRPHVVPEGPLSPQEQLKKFHLPPGFKIELVASEPDIYSPLSLNFDAKGRLWVTDTADYPFPKPGPGGDGLKVFEDTDGDGRYDSATTLVDKLSMPTGAEPVPGGALVFSIPSIFRCRDVDGDGRIDRRDVLYTGFGNVDAHGMNNGFTRWLDGWIYACHGYRNSSQVEGADGQTIAMNSGNGYRFRLDGSHIEYVWHGQVNPYGIAFDSLGNQFTADCHSKPAYCLLRGAYYPSFGKPHDGLGFGPKLIDHAHGSTSISGIAYYAADQFPPPYRESVYMGNSVTGRVNRDTVAARGSSLVGTECADFVTCDDRWFRPVEVKLGPDGALYIADFYDCIIGYYEVPLTHPRRDKTRGRVWRVVYRGTEEKPQRLRKVHDLTQLGLEALWPRLGDPNLSVRLAATHEICDRFADEASASLGEKVLGSVNPHQRAHGLWVLERVGALNEKLVERLADDPHRLVRVHLVKAMAERTDWDVPGATTADLVRRKLFDDDPFVRRAAADALGRNPHTANVPLLLRLLEETPADDTYLVHTARMALRDQLLRPEILAEHAVFDQPDARVHRLLDVLLGVRNPQAAASVLSALEAGNFAAGRATELIHFATRYVADDNLDAVARYVLTWQKATALEQLAAFRSFGLATAERGRQIPEAFYPWAERLVRQLLRAPNPARVIEGIQVAAALRLEALYEPLAEIARSKARTVEVRSAAIHASVPTGGQRGIALLDAILGDPGQVIVVRRNAAAALSAINTDESRALLLERLKTAHRQLAAGLAAALASTPPGAELLMATIEEGKLSPMLLREPGVLRTLEARQGADWAARVAKLTKNLPTLDALTAGRISAQRQAFLTAKPDAKRGGELFTKHCAICHQLDGEGKKFGPDLDGIGVRGLDRLLEDMLDPHRNVDPAFRSTVVLTDDGLTQTGLALRDEGNVLILVNAEGKELRSGHDGIEERFASPLSPMPDGVEKTVGDGELPNLLRFLLQATEAPSEKTAEDVPEEDAAR